MKFETGVVCRHRITGRVYVVAQNYTKGNIYCWNLCENLGGDWFRETDMIIESEDKKMNQTIKKKQVDRCDIIWCGDIKTKLKLSNMKEIVEGCIVQFGENAQVCRIEAGNIHIKYLSEETDKEFMERLVNISEQMSDMLIKVLEDSECGVVPKSHLDKIENFLKEEIGYF